MPLVLIALLWVSQASAKSDWDDLESCRKVIEEETPCLMELSELRPTQFAAGYVAAREKMQELEDKKKEHKLKKYLLKHPVPLVAGPNNEAYLIDHHHLSLAMTWLGEDRVVGEWVSRKKLGKTVEEFWSMMKANAWVYPYDEQGQGPLSPELLPKQIGELKDDPYRSLAKVAREEGCFEKSDEPFAEFRWAQYFRGKVKRFASTPKGVSGALKAAMGLCHLPEARHLPGFTETVK